MQQYHDRATMAMARLIARRRVEEDIRRQGLKLHHFSFKQLMERADAYIAENRDQVMREVLLRKWEKRFEPMRDKGSVKTETRKPHGMGFFRALFC